MKLVNTTHYVEHGSNVGACRTHDPIDDSPTVDPDVARAWELKAQLQWARNDRGLLNGLRWFIWDRYGLGRPPAVVKTRPTPYVARTLPSDTPPAVPALRLVTLDDSESSWTGSFDDAARFDAIEHS